MAGEDQYQRRLTIFSVMPALQIPLGIWLLASTYLLQFTMYGDARMTASFAGPFIVGFAITRLAVSPPWFWVGWANVVLGAFVLISPFLYGLTSITDLTVNFVVVGLLVILTSIVGYFEKAEIRDEQPAA